jgi:fumarate reductase flavoprotein subunit
MGMTILPAADTAFELHFPVVIIGAGAAGLIAALAAREAGAEVLVLERDPLPRGSTALSAGLIPAAGTRWQAAAGIADTPAQFAADIMKKAHDEPDPDLAACVAAESARVVEWLADHHGLEFSVITDFNYAGHGVHRMHGLPSRAGAELMDRLRGAADRAGVEILCNAHVTGLFADADRRITGVAYRRPDGSTEHVGCDALVLACNGYGGNKSMVAQMIPEMAAALYFGHPGNQGDAVLWGQALGAATRHLSGHQGHGSVAHPAGILISWATITAGGIQVNETGARFSDEMQGYSEQAAHVLRQPGGVVWSIFDQRIAGIARQFEDFRVAEQAGAVLGADTIAELEVATRLPAGTLRATLDETARLAHGDGQDRFGRDFTIVPPLAPPYRAVRVTGALFHTQGGLAVDTGARVRDQQGAALPNLFAAGGAAAGVSGDAASGYLSGNGLLVAVSLGFIAGRSAAGG